MSLTLFTTGDGSPTLYHAHFDEHYHSVHGAVQESQHVFLTAGMKALEDRASLRMLEIGFGTGLNALMTAIQATVPIYYLGLEAYPLNREQWESLDYGDRLGHPEMFRALHEAAWGVPVKLSETWTLEKRAEKLETFEGSTHIDLVYWDAFAPSAQPELWTSEIFARVRSWMAPEGLLTTYSAKGDVRRALLAAGWLVEKLPGPPGKREMLRAKCPA